MNTIFIDTTDLGSLRRHWLTMKGPVAGVLFVASRELLVQTANLVGENRADQRRSRLRRLDALFEEGQINRGINDAMLPGEAAIHLDRLADDTICYAVHLPSLCVVYAPGLKPARLQSGPFRWHTSSHG
jgi:hypothetical protein